MSRDDFCRMTVKQYGKVVEAHSRNTEMAEREAWERMRILAAIAIQPHIKKHIRPTDLVPLPWDIPEGAGTPAAGSKPRESREEARARFMRLTGTTAGKS